MMDLFISLLKRLPWLVVLSCIMFWAMGNLGSGDGGMVGVFGWALITFAPFLVMAIMVAGPIAEFLSLPFERLYMPSARVIPPPPWFLIEKYELEGRVVEAMEEYAKVLRYHPQEFQAHVGRMKLAVHGLRDLKLARDYYKKSLTNLEDEVARNELQAAWFEMFPRGLPETNS
ncbi:MAG: hypothetical protein HC904_10150 [Blastochloris sp.]|nr:hypothetical protein [Blastochloris sp.]